MMKTKLAIIKNPDHQYIGDEPSEWESMIPADRRIRMINAFNFYNNTCSRKQGLEFFLHWAENIKHASKSDLSIIRNLSDKEINTTFCWLTRMISKGFVPNQEEIKYISGEFDKLKNIISPITVIATVNKPNIQDYILDKFNTDMGELESHIDQYFIENKTFSALDFLKTRNVSMQHVSKISNILEDRIQELNDYIKGKDEQLNEGYAHLGKSKAKKALKLYTDIINDSVAYRAIKVSSRIRKVRKITPDKLVLKLKYMKTFSELGLNSIDPRDIIGCKELWIYNTKYRKLGRYIACMHGDNVISSLSIKGSKIIGLDDVNSISKRLRKPEIQLKTFSSTGKPQLRKFMDTIKCKESILSPRITPDIILLKAIK